MSGNWVQQADCAVADKWLRARLALMGGADLVLELPTVWATASAEDFARGAVEVLAASGVVDLLSFGSELGEIGPLCRIARCLDSPHYHRAVSALAAQGLPFARCRQQAVASLLGEEAAAPLSRPNNNLGIEYIRALQRLDSSIRPMTVLRRVPPQRGDLPSGGGLLPLRPRRHAHAPIRLRHPDPSGFDGGELGPGRAIPGPRGPGAAGGQHCGPARPSAGGAGHFSQAPVHDRR